MVAAHEDTLTSFRFHVVVGGISEAIFAECSGLQAELQVEEYTEGGVNDVVHKLPGRAKFGNVRLLRGICSSDELWKWWKDVFRGQFSRKDVSIILYSRDGKPVMQWNLGRALPVKWMAPSLKASDSAVAVETLELAFETLGLG